MSSEEFREKIRMSLGCRIEANADCDDFMEVFLSRCEYVHGNYDVDADFQKLDAEMLKTEEGKRAMRVFYLSIPPSIFVPVAQMSSRNVQSKTERDESDRGETARERFGKFESVDESVGGGVEREANV